MIHSTRPTHQTIGNKPRKNPWIKALVFAAWCVGCLVVLAAIALWIISYYLSPDRIIKLIEEKSSEYLMAEVKIGELDYKLFSTYPWLEFEVDSLTVISKSLNRLSENEKKCLPANYDFLASVKTIKGEINVHDLLHDKINLKSIEIVKPDVNIVIVNDTTANFLIAKSLPHTKKVPEIEMSEVLIGAPLDLSFFSLQDDAQARVNMDNFILNRLGGNSYNISFKGVVDGRIQNFKLPSAVPVEFKTNLDFDQKVIELQLKNLALALAGLKLEAKGEMKLNSQEFKLSNAELKINIDDIFTLLPFLPEQISEKIPLPEGLSGNLPLNIDVSLLQPWDIDLKNLNDPATMQNLPPMQGKLKIADANLTFQPPHGEKIVADDIYIESIGSYNRAIPEENYLELKEFRVNGEGITLSGTLYINNLLGEEQEVNGDFQFHSPLMESLSYLMPKAPVKVKGLLKGEIEFQTTAENLGKDGFKNIEFSGDLISHSLNMNSSATGNISIKNLKSDYKASIPAYPLNDYKGTKFYFDLSADSVISRMSDTDVFLSALKMKMDAMDTVSGTPDPSGDITISLGKVKANYGKTSFNAEQVNVAAKGNLNQSGNSGSSQNYPSVGSPSSGNDSILAARVKHTPFGLVYNGGGMLQTVMTLLTLNADLSLQKGEFKTPAYLYPVEFKGLALSTNLNRVSFAVNNLTLGSTSFSMAADLNGLLPFMTSYSATSLSANADINFDNVDINQLSWGYYGALLKMGESADSVYYVAPIEPFTAADSVCVLIPRNLNANIKLRSRSAEYMQYKFSPLSTDIILKDGVATLSKLTVGAPYCTAVVDWTYSTASLDNIFMNLKADVKNFRFSPFYKVFPSLIEKTPELQNFTGDVNAHVVCNFNMFPDMFMEANSLTGRFDVTASDMEFARKGKIEKITHLMLIDGDEPIKIENMNITGFYHDNLLQVNPFKIRFDDYQLEFGGINNIAGDIYYHFALEKSPFHLPFGVTLRGNMHHPEVRLGGTRIDDYQAEMVTTRPDAKLNVNIMAWLKHGWLLFVQEAAKYEGNLKPEK